MFDITADTEMASIGRDLKDHQGPTPLLQAGPPTSIFNTNQAAQGPIQPGLENFQGWGIHSLSGQPVPVPHHLSVKNFPLKSNLNLPSLN